jgi:hypothetical protein
MPTTQSKPGRTRPGRPKGWRKGGVHYSKMVRQRVGDTRALRAAIGVFKTMVVEGLEERLTPDLRAGEAFPDFGLSLDLFRRSVERALERLRTAERQCMERGHQLKVARREAEKLARKEVYPRVVLVRRLIEAQFGKETGRSVHGMAGKTLRKPRRLYGQLQYLVWTLEDGRDQLPEPLIKDFAAEREDWLLQVRPGYQRLTALLDEVTDLELHDQWARDEKGAAMRAFDAAFGEARRLVEAMFIFAGHGGTFARDLRSYAARRLLSRRAREKREARAEGRVKQTLRAAASSVAGWLGSRPRNVA